MPSASSSASIVLCYHRVGQLERDPFKLAITPERFAEQLEVIAARRPLALTELAAALRAKQVPRGGVVVTFDDGYRDNLVAAKPLLERAGVPATVFVTSGATGSPHHFWWDELEALISGADAARGSLTLELGGERASWEVAALHAEGGMYEPWAFLRTLPPQQIEAGMEQLRAWAGSGPRRPASDELQTMTADELRELVRGGLVTVGAHTRTHPVLGAHPAAVQRAELAGSRADLEAIVGEPVRTAAYPFGRRTIEYRGSTVRAIRGLGFDCAVTTDPGLVSAGSRRYELPRHVVPVGLGGEAFERWLAERMAPEARPPPARRLAQFARRTLRERLTPAGRL